MLIKAEADGKSGLTSMKLRNTKLDPITLWLS